MKYSDSLIWLNSFQNFEKMHFLQQGPQWDLERMKLLLKTAAYPQKNYERVLIAGTKGKGSTGFFLETLLEASEIKTGFYSSPHLADPRERIRIRGEMISKEKWAEGMGKAKAVVDKLPLHKFTYFEIMTLLAAICFKSAGVRVGIFEAGMGGRLDATNALDHSLSVLTPIHLDHEEVLGKTIAKIAREKAAIIRKNSDVVTGPQVPEAMGVILQQVRVQKARLLRAEFYPGNPGLAGEFQKVNAGAALQAAKVLSIKMGFRLSDTMKKKNWPGRMEFLDHGRILIDGAHNPVSIEALARGLKSLRIENPVLVFGTSRDKNSAEMLRILSGCSNEIIVTTLPVSRTQQLGILMKQAAGYFHVVLPAANVREALAIARKRAEKARKIVVTGSFYLIGEVRKGFYA